MNCIECDKPSEQLICNICTQLEKLGSMLDKGCKKADKVQRAYDNFLSMKESRIDF